MWEVIWFQPENLEPCPPPTTILAPTLFYRTCAVVPGVCPSSVCRRAARPAEANPIINCFVAEYRRLDGEPDRPGLPDDALRRAKDTGRLRSGRARA